MTAQEALDARVDALLAEVEARHAAWRSTPRWRPLRRLERGKAWVAAVDALSRVELERIRQRQSDDLPTFEPRWPESDPRRRPGGWTP